MKKNIFSIVLNILLVILLAANVFFIAIQFSPVYFLQNIKESQKEKTLIEYIEKNFYQDVDSTALQEGKLKGIVGALDDEYSTYFTAEEYKKYVDYINKSFGGIGATLIKDQDSGEITVTAVLEGSPAEKAGIRIQDIIVSVDDVTGKDMELTPFVEKVRGAVGTEANLLIRRGNEEFTVIVVRDEIHQPTVSSDMITDTVGYVAISNFSTNTYDEFVKAIESIIREGATSVVYDLRNNSGGYVDTCTKMLDYLLPEGILVYTEDKNGNRHDYTSDKESSLDMPCVVLVNENTASASEIFCGAIRDFDYGKIVGTTTFGKGVIQNGFGFSDGSGVKITTAQYFTPKGTVIHKVGITPDYELEYEYTQNDEEEFSYLNDNQIAKALEILEP